MLYVARYQGKFSSRREELLRQRSLAEELLGWSLQNEYGLQLSSLSRGRTSSGKPFFLDCPLHFSLSHTRGMVCCALSAFPVGGGCGRPPAHQRGSGTPRMHGGGVCLACRSKGQGRGFFVPVDAEGKRDEAFRPWAGLRPSPGGFFHGGCRTSFLRPRRAPFAIFLDGRLCCLRRLRG